MDNLCREIILIVKLPEDWGPSGDAIVAALKTLSSDKFNVDVAASYVDNDKIALLMDAKHASK